MEQQAATEEKKDTAYAFPKRLTPPQPSFVKERDDLADNWLKHQVPAMEKLPEVPISNEVSKVEKGPEQLDLFDGKLLEPKARSMHKLIGQLFDTYWLVEFNEQLFIIDQHAAHEKVLYEKPWEHLRRWNLFPSW